MKSRLSEEFVRQAAKRYADQYQALLQGVTPSTVETASRLRFDGTVHFHKPIPPTSAAFRRKTLMWMLSILLLVSVFVLWGVTAKLFH